MIASADVAQLVLSLRLPPNVQEAENPSPPKKSSSARLPIAATVEKHACRSLSRDWPVKNAGLTQEIWGTRNPKLNMYKSKQTPTTRAASFNTAISKSRPGQEHRTQGVCDM